MLLRIVKLNQNNFSCYFFTQWWIAHKLYSMYEFALTEVLNKYGIKSRMIFNSQKGYRNEIWPILTLDNQKLSVIFYKREDGIVDRIRRADKASEYLALNGLPTRKRFDKRIVKLKSGELETNVGIYNYLPGDTIPWESYTMKHIKLLGKTMSDMHSKLSKVSIDDYPSVYDEYNAINGRMKTYFSNTQVQKAIFKKLKVEVNPKIINNFQDLLNILEKEPDQQVLHMDFVRGNILFDKAKPEYSLCLDNIAISGILDFEKTAKGHPVMDIARTLAFLLADCKYKQSEKIYKYFLFSGYQKRGASKDISDDKIRENLIEMFLLYDFYKFLRHNPYESLYQNEHYIRTRDILSTRGVIFYK